MQTTNAQVRRLMEELQKHGKVGLSAMRSGMSRNTGTKYKKLGKLPSELKKPRDWRTRPDPFAEDWPELESRLRDAPELEAKTLFEVLQERNPDRYEPGQLRTLQRRLKQWRAQEGPPKEVFFPQEHRPGEAMQTDFTWATSLAVTIVGEPFPHMLCHSVLPYSNWGWATICRSESLAAIKRGFQAALFRIGRVPKFHQTDNSTAATHDLASGKRGFNADYQALMDHFGIEPKTIQIGKKNQNGDVEALNGALKRRLDQHLQLRGSRDFESVEIYERWLGEVLEKTNRLRRKRMAEELAVMRPLVVERLVEYTEERVRVTSWSTIRVKHNTYSVPSRLKDEWVKVRLYEDSLQVLYGDKHQLTVERLIGRNGHSIDYRHIIWSLVRKPGAFARYRYREALFPSLTFRRSYDLIRAMTEERKADLEYLRILHLAASTMESDVEAALELLLEAGQTPSSDGVKALVAPEKTELPELEVQHVDLRGYDALLGEVGA